MSNAVPVDLEDLNARNGWVLESRIDQQSEAEVPLLIVELLLLSILFTYRLHVSLRSVEIMQEIRSGGGRAICHNFFG